MKTPLILLIISALLCVIGLLSPAWSDLLLLGVPCVLASLYLLWKALRSKAPPQNWVIVDGSNVMHWIDNTPDIQPVRDVLARLEQLGYTAGVIFDASAGHRLGGKYWHDDTFSTQLGLPKNRIMVVPKGTVADHYILTAARGYSAKVVTNDRFRDWAEEFPEVRNSGFLITGWYRDGRLFTSLG